MRQINSLPRYPSNGSAELPKARWNGTVPFLICSTVIALACVVGIIHFFAPVLWMFLFPPFVYFYLAFFNVFGSILIGLFVFARQTPGRS